MKKIMDASRHPFGYTIAMRQAILTTAIVSAVFAVPFTVSLFTSSAFANSFYGLAYSLM